MSRPSRDYQRLRRLLTTMATVLLSVAALLLVGVVTAGALGYRTLVVESGSMVPALQIGDLVVSEQVAPASVRPGNIVTFRDVVLRHELVTHRVVRMVRDGPVIHFTTKGDANRVAEHWSIPVTGRIGREVTVIPFAGRMMADLTTKTVRIVVIWLLALWIISACLRHLWRPAMLNPPASEHRLAVGHDGPVWRGGPFTRDGVCLPGPRPGPRLGSRNDPRARALGGRSSSVLSEVMTEVFQGYSLSVGTWRTLEPYQ